MKVVTSIARLIASIFICELAGIIGSYFTIPSVSGWYTTLMQPGFSPPNWAFAPIWSILFALMGIAAFLIWNKGLEQREIKLALQVFGAQLLLNLLWTILFFGLQSPRAALIEIISLWISILATIIAFYRISKPAAYLLIPYLFWVSFAVILNFAFWLIN